MSDLATCRADYEAANPFTSLTHSLADGLRAGKRLEAAQVEAWRAGECCEDRGECGECRSIAVQLARLGKLRRLGLRVSDARDLSRACERSSEYAEQFPALRDVGTDEQKAEAWRIWAERFIQEFEGVIGGAEIDQVRLPASGEQAGTVRENYSAEQSARVAESSVKDL